MQFLLTSHIEIDSKTSHQTLQSSVTVMPRVQLHGVIPYKTFWPAMGLYTRGLYTNNFLMRIYTQKAATGLHNMKITGRQTFE